MGNKMGLEQMELLLKMPPSYSSQAEAKAMPYCATVKVTFLVETHVALPTCAHRSYL